MVYVSDPIQHSIVFFLEMVQLLLDILVSLSKNHKIYMYMSPNLTSMTLKVGGRGLNKA